MGRWCARRSPRRPADGPGPSRRSTSSSASCARRAGSPSSATRSTTSSGDGSDHGEAPGMSLRLGRIGYVNMAPVFFRLEYEVDEIVGVPTELNRMLLDGEVDVA